jgi:hypothetical protein
LATALAYNAIMKIEAGNTPKYHDGSQSGAAGKCATAVKPLLAVPFAAPYPSQSKQKKTDNLSASKPAVPFLANTQSYPCHQVALASRSHGYRLMSLRCHQPPSF